MSALHPIATAKADMPQMFMSALLRKRTCAVQLRMSALGPKADINDMPGCAGTAASATFCLCSADPTMYLVLSPILSKPQNEVCDITRLRG